MAVGIVLAIMFWRQDVHTSRWPWRVAQTFVGGGAFILAAVLLSKVPDGWPVPGPGYYTWTYAMLAAGLLVAHGLLVDIDA